MSLLTRNQEIFAQAFSSTSGVDLNVARAWVLQEEAGGPDNGANNWLGIGITNSGSYGYANKVWSNPKTAGVAAGNWLLGNPIGSGGASPTGYGAPGSAISSIPNAGGPLQQILAIQSSGWASGGEISLGSLYNEVVGSPQQKIPLGRVRGGTTPTAAVRSRPGGQVAGTSASGADVDSVLTGWSDSEKTVPPVPSGVQTSGLFSGVPLLGQIPLIDDIPNPLDVVKGLTSGVSDIVGFLKILAWVINPANILRMVEFLLGLGLMAFGIQAAMQGRGEKADAFSTGEAAISRSGLGRVSKELAAKATPEGRAVKRISPASAPHKTRRTALRVRYEREQDVSNRRTAARRGRST